MFVFGGISLVGFRIGRHISVFGGISFSWF